MDKEKPKMHFGGLEKCILVRWALSFDGLGGWTKKMQNAFWVPGEMHFGSWALSFDGLGGWTKKTQNAYQNAFWVPGEMHCGSWGPFI